MVAFAVVAVAAVALAATLLGSGDGGENGDGGGGGTNRPTARPVSIAAIQSFDPEGSDGEENGHLARLAIDGSQTSFWRSDQYTGPSFGRLKSGVGLVLQLDAPSRLAELKAFSPVEGWSASVYVADRAGSELSQWGRPVTSEISIAGDVTFDLSDTTGRAVLLWITDPGPSNRAEITELTLSGS